MFLAWARPKDFKFRFVLSNFPVILVILSMFSFQFPREKTIPALLGHPGCCPRAARVAADHIPLWPPWKYGQFPEVLEKPSRLSGLTTASRVPFSETCTNTFRVLKTIGQEEAIDVCDRKPVFFSKMVTFLHSSHPKLMEKISPFYSSNETSTNHPESGLSYGGGCKVLVSTIPQWHPRIPVICKVKPCPNIRQTLNHPDLLLHASPQKKH